MAFKLEPDGLCGIKIEKRVKIGAYIILRICFPHGDWQYLLLFRVPNILLDFMVSWRCW